MKYRYHCWNPDCKVYCGYGHLINSISPLKTCPHCGHLLEDCTHDAPAWFYSIAFGVVGALFGLVFASWQGALICLIAGLLVSIVFFYPEPPKKKG